MTMPETPLEDLTLEELREKVAQLQEIIQDREANYTLLQNEVLRLTERASRVDEIDQVTRERNNARQELVETEQERVRLYSLLQETVRGVAEWVPDLTPVGNPPAELPPALWDTWVADQIAGRRTAWDTFVNRVTAQASA